MARMAPCRGRYPSAAELGHDLLRFQRGEPASYLVAKQQYPEALRYFQAALAIQPDAAVVHYDVSVILLQLGRSDAGCGHQGCLRQ
jgi:hypothetical protein